MAELLFSVCICTRNRADLLAAALESVSRQSFDPARFEVVVIDNASSDATPVVIEAFSRRCPNLRGCVEPVVGLAHARNRAAREARAAWLAYLDDDALAPDDWLAVAAEVIAAEPPDLLGGPFYAYYTTPKPVWYRDSYGSVEQGPLRRRLGPSEYLAGGNLFIRRDRLLASDGFPTEFGMAGERIAYGEETVLQRRLRHAHPDLRVIYEPRLAIRHRVAPQKMRLAAEVRRRWLEGRSSYLVFSDGVHTLSPRHLIGLLSLPVIILAEALVGVLLRSRQRYPYGQNYYYEVVLSHIALLGKLYQRTLSWFQERRS